MTDKFIVDPLALAFLIHNLFATSTLTALLAKPSILRHGGELGFETVGMECVVAGLADNNLVIIRFVLAVETGLAIRALPLNAIAR